jgi:hypothetical protein
MRKSTTRLLQLKTSRRITHTSLSTKKKISIRQPMRVKLSHNLPPQTNSDSTMTKITLPTSTSLLNSSHLMTPTKDTSSSSPRIQEATSTMRSLLRSLSLMRKSTPPRYFQAMTSQRRRRSQSLKKNPSTTLQMPRKTTRRTLYSLI